MSQFCRSHHPHTCGPQLCQPVLLKCVQHRLFRQYSLALPCGRLHSQQHRKLPCTPYSQIESEWSAGSIVLTLHRSCRRTIVIVETWREGMEEGPSTHAQVSCDVSSCNVCSPAWSVWLCETYMCCGRLPTSSSADATAPRPCKQHSIKCCLWGSATSAAVGHQ
jgi:hypothetical protein